MIESTGFAEPTEALPSPFDASKNKNKKLSRFSSSDSFSPHVLSLSLVAYSLVHAILLPSSVLSVFLLVVFRSLRPFLSQFLIHSLYVVVPLNGSFRSNSSLHLPGRARTILAEAPRACASQSGTSNNFELERRLFRASLPDEPFAQFSPNSRLDSPTLSLCRGPWTEAK